MAMHCMNDCECIRLQYAAVCWCASLATYSNKKRAHWHWASTSRVRSEDADTSGRVISWGRDNKVSPCKPSHNQTTSHRGKTHNNNLIMDAPPHSNIEQLIPLASDGYMWRSAASDISWYLVTGFKSFTCMYQHCINICITIRIHVHVVIL